MPPCLAFLILALATGLWSTAASTANAAAILASESTVPSSIFPGSTVTARVRVRNTGTTTWSRNAAYRLGAVDDELPWPGYTCGGYTNRLSDARAFLCRDVPPGGRYDFDVVAGAPSTASGSLALSVRMVRDGVEWFRESRAFGGPVEVRPTLPDAVDAVAVHPQGQRAPDNWPNAS